ncbi:MAG TPA: sodium:proton antiporter, partial [Verrucomicrobiae bacterium]
GLDNAPTYLGFWQCLRGVSGLADTQTLLSTQTVHVAAISVGAVFFGAATYIGNGPNFMIKAIAERAGVRMPSFAAYVWKYALPGLLPGLLLVWWWFFRD